MKHRRVYLKPLQFKRFKLSCGGNLQAMGVDLEAAQVLGARDLFLPTSVVNDPGPTRSVNKVKTMGPKVKVKD
jgi:hypothetical protein